MDQHLFCRADRLFNGMELLGDIKAGAATPDHPDNIPEMP
jgi:hypothetical protein